MATDADGRKTQGVLQKKLVLFNLVSMGDEILLSFRPDEEKVLLHFTRGRRAVCTKHRRPRRPEEETKRWFQTPGRLENKMKDSIYTSL